MTYYNICSKCGKQFLTGDRKDTTCSICNGDFPALKYYEVEK